MCKSQVTGHRDVPLTSRHATTDFADAQRAAVASTGAPRRNAESTIPRPWPFGARARASRHEKITLAPVTNSCQTLNARRRHARRAGVKGLRQASKQASKQATLSCLVVKRAHHTTSQEGRRDGAHACAPKGPLLAIRRLYPLCTRLGNASCYFRMHYVLLSCTTTNHAAFSRCTDLVP